MKQPMWDIIGHQKQLTYLSEDIQEKRLKHAYLFTGPEKIGKFRLIRKFAQMLQCENQGCGTCQICQHISQNIHPDTLLYKNEGEVLKIEDIRFIIEKTSKTFFSPYLVIAIESIERMTDASGHALLKTLEEPPANVIFLFTTDNIHKILDTILSRVFVIHLGDINTEELMEAFKVRNPTIAPEKIKEYIELSHGKPGMAIRMLEDETYYQKRKNFHQELLEIVQNSSINERMKYIEEWFSQKKTDPKVFSRDICQEISYMLQNDIEQYFIRKKPLFFQKTLPDLTQSIEKVQNAFFLLESNVNRRLVLEELLLSLK